MGLLKLTAARDCRTVMKLWGMRTLTTTPICETAGSTSKAPLEHYDIIIGGGGMVGTTLAVTLAKDRVLSDKRVLLLESAPPFKGFDPCKPYRNRVSALNLKTIQLFKSIDAWHHMLKSRIKPVKQMQVWDASSDALIQFQHDHFAHDVACIVENDLILDSMYAQIEKNRAPNVTLRNEACIDWVRVGADTENGFSEVGLKNGDSYTCDLLIGADGANSLVRKEMNVDVFSINYKHKGLVATLDLEEAGDNSVAWQRFIPTGPVALLPLNDTTSSLVWSTTMEQADKLLEMPEKEFVDALNYAFCQEYEKNEIAVRAVNAINYMMGRSANAHRQYPPRVRAVREKSRATFPLGFLHAASYVCSGAALIGDAAHRLHPLAGQGVNLGFSDVRFLVDALSDGAYGGAKLGDKKHLIKYEQNSLTKNVPILIGVHGLQTMYSSNFSPVVLLRSLGLQLTQNMPEIKNIFMKRAMN